MTDLEPRKTTWADVAVLAVAGTFVLGMIWLLTR